MTHPINYYQKRLDEGNLLLAKYRNQSLLLSTARLLSFLLAATLGYYAIRQQAGTMAIPAFIAFLLFGYLLSRALQLREKTNLLQKQLLINRNELQLLSGGSNSLPGVISDLEMAEANDLDLFGPHSLFDMIRRTATIHGQQKLAEVLLAPSTDPSDIKLRQKAVAQLSTQPCIREDMLALALLHGEKEGNLDSLKDWLLEGDQLSDKKWVSFILWILPVINISLLAWYIHSGQIGPLLWGSAASWLITGLYLKYINHQQVLLGKKTAILDQYAAILNRFKQVNTGDSTILKELQKECFESGKAFQRLSRLSARLDQRLNMLMGFFLNTFLLHDLHCMVALEKWRRHYSSDYQKWVHTVAEIEYLNSLAFFAFNNPDYIYPTLLQSENLQIKAVGLGHPLIPAGQRVVNDISIGLPQKLMLITGSNMSGKTTFLRTVGINIILAQAGAPVPAKSLAFTPVRVLSSIRISDSLQEHTSYFMAELMKLRAMIDVLEKGVPCLILIDEILRGTNSDDKTHGSELFIRKLLKYNCLTLFATHDLVLSQLETTLPGQVSNACFESIIQDNELQFDYKLHEGVAQNKNASFLMKKMGIIE